MQEAKLLILLHLPMAEEQCPSLSHRQRWLGEGEATAERSNWTPNKTLQLASANNSGQSRALLWLPVAFPCMMPMQERASQNSAVAPRPLQNKLFGPQPEGSITAKLGRSCSVLCNGPSGTKSPAACGAVYNQRCVFNVQNLH